MIQEKEQLKNNSKMSENPSAFWWESEIKQRLLLKKLNCQQIQPICQR